MRGTTASYTLKKWFMSLSCTVYWTITEFGFDKEPKLLWVRFEVCFSEFDEHITLTAAIPEFHPFLILPLLMIATLLEVIIHRSKYTQ